MVTLPALVAGMMAFGVEAGENAGALWQVEKVCLANHATTGLAFPCLEVRAATSGSAGYVVLRPPLGPGDTVLMPAEKSPGIEDARLQSANAPNYFDQAWNARHFIAGKTSRPLARADVALAVNAQITRSQDQLHVHLDCIAGDVRAALQEMEPAVPARGWVALPRPIRHLRFWAYRVRAETLDGINPFALVARDIPGARLAMGQMTIVVAGSHFKDGGKGFLLLAARVGGTRADAVSTGEELLDHSCAG